MIQNKMDTIHKRCTKWAHDMAVEILTTVWCNKYQPEVHNSQITIYIPVWEQMEESLQLIQTWLNPLYLLMEFPWALKLELPVAISREPAESAYVVENLAKISVLTWVVHMFIHVQVPDGSSTCISEYSCLWNQPWLVG